MAKRNAEVVLRYSTVYPFRLRGNTLVCVYCREVYEDPGEYRGHLDEMHKEFTVSTAFAHCGTRKDYIKVDITDLECRICRMPFEDIDGVAKHISDSHLVTKLNLNYDIGMHPYKMEKGNWTCCVCGKRLATLTTLGRHMSIHYQRYTCDACGRNYLTHEALSYHIKCAHSGKHSCTKCWEEFIDLKSKKDHVKVSKMCWPFVCVYCRERFPSWEKKQDHLVEFHKRPARIYECPECGKVFEKRKKFYLHYKLDHTDDNYVCSYCAQKFVNKKALMEHIVGHSGEKTFLCSICPKAFSRAKALKQHMWIHDENKRFSCTVCDKRFAQKVSFKKHMKTHHPNANFES